MIEAIFNKIKMILPNAETKKGYKNAVSNMKTKKNPELSKAENAFIENMLKGTYTNSEK